MSHATGETLYQFRNATKAVLQRERANVTALAAYRDGALAAPSEGTYTLARPDGTVVVTGAVVVTGDIATYTLAAVDLPATLELGVGYLELWDLVMPDGRTYNLRRPVCLGLFQLFPPVSPDDLVEGEYPDLETSLGPSGATTLQAFMDATWNACVRHLERHGDWPDIVVDSSDLFDWYRHEVLKRAFKAMLQRQDSVRWRELYVEHRDGATAAKDGLAITVDRDRDGKPDHDGKEAVMRTVHRNVPPRRWRTRGNPRF